MAMKHLFPGHSYYADSTDNSDAPVCNWDNGWWPEGTASNPPYFIVTIRGMDGFFIVTEWGTGEMIGPFDAATTLATIALRYPEVTG